MKFKLASNAQALRIGAVITLKLFTSCGATTGCNVTLPARLNNPTILQCSL